MKVLKMLALWNILLVEKHVTHQTVNKSTASMEHEKPVTWCYPERHIQWISHILFLWIPLTLSSCLTLSFLNDLLPVHSSFPTTVMRIFFVPTVRSTFHAHLLNTRTNRIYVYSQGRTFRWLQKTIEFQVVRKFDPGSVHVGFMVDKVTLG
jgi:hypothetical protein